jgi:ABC-type Mn2+/Zn2+ transport system permease subunit
MGTRHRHIRGCLVVRLLVGTMAALLVTPSALADPLHRDFVRGWFDAMFQGLLPLLAGIFLVVCLLFFACLICFGAWFGTKRRTK